MKNSKGMTFVEGLLAVVFVALLVAMIIPIVHYANLSSKTVPSVSKAGVSDRFDLTLVSKFKDDLAYGQERGVYILKDKTTGEEYIGVSGIGITELGSHGKGHRDER